MTRKTDTSLSYTTSTPSHYKVNSIPYVTSLLALRNGLLLDTPTYIHDRSTSTSTEIKGARGLKADKSHAWKRRRKRRKKSGQSSASGTTALPAAVLPPERYYRFPKTRYYRSVASPRSFGAKYVQMRHYRP